MKPPPPPPIPLVCASCRGRGTTGMLWWKSVCLTCYGAGGLDRFTNSPVPLERRPSPTPAPPPKTPRIEITLPSRARGSIKIDGVELREVLAIEYSRSWNSRVGDVGPGLLKVTLRDADGIKFIDHESTVVLQPPPSSTSPPPPPPPSEPPASGSMTKGG